MILWGRQKVNKLFVHASISAMENGKTLKKSITALQFTYMLAYECRFSLSHNIPLYMLFFCMVQRQIKIVYESYK